LTTDERAELERRVRSLKIRAEDARRARVILMLANCERRQGLDHVRFHDGRHTALTRLAELGDTGRRDTSLDTDGDA
jgi:integrase